MVGFSAGAGSAGPGGSEPAGLPLPGAEGPLFRPGGVSGVVRSMRQILLLSRKTRWLRPRA